MARKNNATVEQVVYEAIWLAKTVKVTSQVHRPARTSTVTEKISGSVGVRLSEGFALLQGGD